jgi:hypothetical protein
LEIDERPPCFPLDLPNFSAACSLLLYSLLRLFSSKLEHRVHLVAAGQSRADLERLPPHQGEESKLEGFLDLSASGKEEGEQGVS